MKDVALPPILIAFLPLIGAVVGAWIERQWSRPLLRRHGVPRSHLV